MKKALSSIAVLSIVAACSSGYTAPTEPRIYATEALAIAPVVTSRATMKKYAALFQTACLQEASDYTNTLAKFATAGMQEIQGPVGGNERRGAAYSDGTAYAHLFVRNDGYTICEVALKTYDDDPLLEDLKSVVAGSQFGNASFSEGGLLGAGYSITKRKSVDKAITVSRQKRSAQSPTYFRILDFNR